jgi:hypothetical protein
VSSPLATGLLSYSDSLYQSVRRVGATAAKLQQRTPRLPLASTLGKLPPLNRLLFVAPVHIHRWRPNRFLRPVRWVHRRQARMLSLHAQDNNRVWRGLPNRVSPTQKLEKRSCVQLPPGLLLDLWKLLPQVCSEPFSGQVQD